jgi:hypothetical protein
MMGFISGEGSFYIARAGVGRVRPCFEIHMLRDDARILHKFARHTKLGFVVERENTASYYVSIGMQEAYGIFG